MEYVSVTEAAKRLGMSESWVWKQVQGKVIPSKKDGKRRLVAMRYGNKPTEPTPESRSKTAPDPNGGTMTIADTAIARSELFDLTLRLNQNQLTRLATIGLKGLLDKA